MKIALTGLALALIIATTASAYRIIYNEGGYQAVHVSDGKFVIIDTAKGLVVRRCVISGCEDVSF
jgi:hypothetical protein